MARGAKTIKIDNEGGDLEVTLWVSRDGELQVSIEDEYGNDHFDVFVALEVAKAIKRLAKWAETEKGQKRIALMQKKEQKDYDR